MRLLLFLVGGTCLFTFPTKIVAQSLAPCLKIKQFWTSYDGLPQDGSMDVKLSWKAHDCVVPSKVNGKPELSNITVAIQDISGLDAQIGQEGLIDFQNGAAQELQLTLQLTASPELPVGRRMFLLKIDYDVLNRKGALYRQTIYTPIPVRVVGQNALVRKNRGPSEQWNPWELLALPVNILEYLVEAVSGQIC